MEIGKMAIFCSDRIVIHETTKKASFQYDVLCIHPYMLPNIVEHIDQTMKARNMQLFMGTADFGQMKYVAVITNISNQQKNLTSAYLKQRVERIVDWLKFAILVPAQQGTSPLTAKNARSHQIILPPSFACPLVVSSPGNGEM